MLYKEKPNDYITELEVAGCIIEHDGKMLLLQQAPHKNSPGTWLEPAGKADTGESPEQTMIREIFEETGITIKTGESDFLFKKYFYYLGMNISIDFFYIKLKSIPDVIISDEHSNYIWVSPSEALKMNLVEDFDEIVKEVYGV